MAMLGTCFLFHLLLAVAVADVAVGRRNGYDPELRPKRMMVDQEITTDWTTFYFTNQGSYAFPTFSITPNTGDSIQVTDYFCCGDTFTVYIDFPTVPLAVAFNTSDPAVVSCDTYQLDPLLAFIGGQFSILSYTFVSTDPANITIVANTSPFTSGGGAIRKVLVTKK